MDPDVHPFSRPRALYASLFVWYAVSGGRFLAPFLKDQIPRSFSSDTLVGLTLAIQFLLSCLAAPFTGALADRLEEGSARKGRGHVKMLVFGVASGTVFLLLHEFGEKFIFFEGWGRLAYHMGLRMGYGLSSACTMPILDGLTMAYLKREKVGKIDVGGLSGYGEERLHGELQLYS